MGMSDKGGKAWVVGLTEVEKMESWAKKHAKGMTHQKESCCSTELS